MPLSTLKQRKATPMERVIKQQWGFSLAPSKATHKQLRTEVCHHSCPGCKVLLAELSPLGLTHTAPSLLALQRTAPTLYCFPSIANLLACCFFFQRAHGPAHSPPGKLPFHHCFCHPGWHAAPRLKDDTACRLGMPELAISSRVLPWHRFLVATLRFTASKGVCSSKRPGSASKEFICKCMGSTYWTRARSTSHRFMVRPGFAGFLQPRKRTQSLPQTWTKHSLVLCCCVIKACRQGDKISLETCS